MNNITQLQYDNLAMFVAVLRELRSEPFFGEDNHDTLHRLGNGKYSISIGHPSFLKSAILPFRKLWLSSEPCAFTSIRDWVYSVHPDQFELNGYRSWFFQHYEQALCELPSEHANLSAKDVVEIWLYTHAVHAGPKRSAKTSTNSTHRTLEEFDKWSRSLGRERFEFLFRSQLQTIGSIFLEFGTHLAEPLYRILTEEKGMKPGFEAEVALTFNPYADRKFDLKFNDPFWHLNKESSEETFDRLLARQRFNHLGQLFEALFTTRSEAIASVTNYSDINSLFKSLGVTILSQFQRTEAKFLLEAKGVWGKGSVSFQVFEDRSLRIDAPSLSLFEDYYTQFCELFLEQRELQAGRAEWAYRPRWDSRT